MAFHGYGEAKIAIEPFVQDSAGEEGLERITPEVRRVARIGIPLIDPAAAFRVLRSGPLPLVILPFPWAR